MRNLVCFRLLTVLLAVIAHNAFAQPVEQKSANKSDHDRGQHKSPLDIENTPARLFVKEFCVHGMQFVAVLRGENFIAGIRVGDYPSVMQVLNEKGLPMRCNAVPANPN